jgi:Flp pilus assembly protein TadD
MHPSAEWEKRSAELWASFNAAPDEWDEDDFRKRVDELAGELGPDDPVAAFERACAWDSTGHSDQAVPLYRKALELGIDGIRRRRSVIQMSSSLRNIGQAEESVRLLTEERERGSDELDDAVSATLALALTSVGREREAVSIAVAALAKHLPRYQRSMANYARLLVAPDED